MNPSILFLAILLSIPSEAGREGTSATGESTSTTPASSEPCTSSAPLPGPDVEAMSSHLSRVSHRVNPLKLGETEPTHEEFMDSVKTLCQTFNRLGKEAGQKHMPCTYLSLLYSMKKRFREDANAGEKRNLSLHNEDHQLAIYIYTSGIYKSINPILNSEAETLKHRAFLDMFVYALKRLPQAPFEPNELASRGDNNPREGTYVEGEHIYHKGLYSLSKGKPGFYGTYKYHVKTTSARDISAFSTSPSENEVILLPGTVLKVTKIEPAASARGQTHIYLEEVSTEDTGGVEKPVIYKKDPFAKKPPEGPPAP